MIHPPHLVRRSPAPIVRAFGCERGTDGACGWRSVQLEALYSLLDDDGSGSLTVHEMIDLFVRRPMPSPSPQPTGPTGPPHVPLLNPESRALPAPRRA